MDLNDLAFGKIRVSEILGAEPDLETTGEMLEEEVRVLLEGLDGKNSEELNMLKSQQLRVHREINSRPGAMALPQSKIKLFTDFSSRYIEAIEKRIG